MNINPQFCFKEGVWCRLTLSEERLKHNIEKKRFLGGELKTSGNN